MKTDRSNAFTDGLITIIIITNMVLELKLPEEPTYGGVRQVAPKGEKHE